MDQYQERQEILQKLNIYKANKLWSEVTVGKTKMTHFKDQLDKAQVDCKTHKNLYELQKRAQEKISQKTSDLRNKTLEQVKTYI